MPTLARLFLVAALVTLPVPLPAGILRVSPDGNGSNPATWEGAHATITAAIDSAQAGDQIWVRQGRYNESLTLKSGIGLYGGFEGDESDTSFQERGWRVYKTILDATGIGRSCMYADHVASATIDGITSMNGRASPFFSQSPNANGGGLYCTNSAMSLARCAFVSNVAEDYGGGIYADQSILALSECLFSSNHGWGGGFACDDSDVTFVGTTFLQNHGRDLGGALRLERGSIRVSLLGCMFQENDSIVGGAIGVSREADRVLALTSVDCVFEQNKSTSTAFAYGGGVYIADGNVSFRECEFHKNGSEIFQAGSGGAVYVSITDDVLIEDCTFTENFASLGGAVYFYGSEGVIRRCLFERNLARQGGAAGFEPRGKVVDCVFRQNTANVVGGAVEVAQIGSTGDFSMERCLLAHNHSQQDGGALLCNISNATISNCVIASNTAERFGGGVLQHFGDYTRFINCTIADNHCGELGGGVCRFQDEPYDFGVDWNNCILYGNAPDQIAGATADNLRLTYSLVQGGWAGKGNIDADPLFQDAGGGDYRLQLASPCIDTASGTGPSEDLPGNPRPVDIPGVGHDGEGTFDMGAYEFQLAEMPTPTPTLTETPIPTPTLHPGTDINQDNVVDVNDLLLLILDWQKVSGP